MFFPQRSKCINSHWSLKWSSIYLFSQKTSPFTSKWLSQIAIPQENSRFKNSRSILNDPSFSRPWIFFFFLSHPHEVPVSYCPYIAPASRQASYVSPHCCLDLGHHLMLTFSHYVSVNFGAVEHYVPIEHRDVSFLEKWRWKIFITLMVRKFTLESFI